MTFCQWLDYWFDLSCLEFSMYAAMFWGAAMVVAIVYESLSEV